MRGEMNGGVKGGSWECADPSDPFLDQMFDGLGHVVQETQTRDGVGGGERKGRVGGRFREGGGETQVVLGDFSELSGQAVLVEGGTFVLEHGFV